MIIQYDEYSLILLLLHYYKMLMLIGLHEVQAHYNFLSAFPRKYIVSRSQTGTGHGIRVVGTRNSGGWDVECQSFFSLRFAGR